ncbi:hypothetical protein, partial [Pseudomonas syringae]|uniref:hypothetical protein n=1 Tax=Pseudomonas syringae TaxID=317 RepID=UPI001966D8D9
SRASEALIAWRDTIVPMLRAERFRFVIQRCARDQAAANALSFAIDLNEPSLPCNHPPAVCAPAA